MKKIILIPIFLLLASSAIAQEGFQLTMNLGLEPTVEPLDLAVNGLVEQANGSHHFLLLGEVQWRIEQPIAIGIGTGLYYYAETVNNVRVPAFLAATFYLPENIYTGDSRYEPLLKARAGNVYNFRTYKERLSSFLYMGVGVAMEEAYRETDIMVNAGVKIMWYKGSGKSRGYPSFSVGWTF